MALSILAMIGSGWRIYNASPIFPFTFPEWITLGGDVKRHLRVTAILGSPPPSPGTSPRCGHWW